MTVTVLVFIFLKANLRHYEILSLHTSLKSLDVTSIPQCCKKSRVICVITSQNYDRKPPSHLTEISALPSWFSFCLSLKQVPRILSLLTSLTHALKSLCPQSGSSITQNRPSGEVLRTPSFKRRVSHM